MCWEAPLPQYTRFYSLACIRGVGIYDLYVCRRRSCVCDRCFEEAVRDESRKGNSKGRSVTNPAFISLQASGKSCAGRMRKVSRIWLILQLTRVHLCLAFLWCDPGKPGPVTDRFLLRSILCTSAAWRSGYHQPALSQCERLPYLL